MRAYTLTDVDDHELVSQLKSLVVKDRGTTAEILAHIAEVDSRRLYLPAAHPSMFSYCQKELGFSEEMAFKRIRAARMARKYPVIFAAIADGRLHVSAVVLLSKYLRRDNADELLRAAFRKSKTEIVELLAERFQKADLPTLVRAIPAPRSSGNELSPQPARPRRKTSLMRAYTLTDVDDHELVSQLKSLVVKDRGTTAEILAHIAEVDSRRLYLPAAHPSMFSYCQKELGFSEEMAFKRIRAARMARKYPVIFAAIADGRLHVSAVVLLSKYLRRDNADELLRAAFRKSKTEIVELLAERFQKADLPTLVRAIPAPRSSGNELSPYR